MGRIVMAALAVVTLAAALWRIKVEKREEE